MFFFHILGISSSQLTFTFFRWVGQSPTSNGMFIFSVFSNGILPVLRHGKWGRPYWAKLLRSPAPKRMVFQHQPNMVDKKPGCFTNQINWWMAGNHPEYKVNIVMKQSRLRIALVGDVFTYHGGRCWGPGKIDPRKSHWMSEELKIFSVRWGCQCSP